MITTLIALYALSPNADPVAQNPTAVSVIQKMLQRYAEAKTLVGTVRFTQAANGVTVVTQSLLQHERPSKLYLRQTRSGGSEERTWLVTSDGNRFTYDKPEANPGKDVRLIEAVARKEVAPHTISSIFQASGGSLGDRGAALIVALGDNEHLRFLLGQWAGLQYAGKAQAGGVEAHLIKGKWRRHAQGQVKGTFELFVSEEGDLIRYAQREVFDQLPDKRAKAFEITSVWEVDLKVNAKVDPELFKVVT